MGYFLTLEGIDGCGKTTIAQMLVDYLQNEGYEVVYTREPGGNVIAEKIRDIILDPQLITMDYKTEALLYVASRRQHLVEKIIPALENGKIVICDRFIDSSLAYQGYARGLGIDAIYQLNSFVIENCMPDKTIFFDVSLENANQRLQNRQYKLDRLDLENSVFHQKVFEGYQIVNEKFKERIISVDANKTIESVFEEVLNVLKGCLDV